MDKPYPVSIRLTPREYEAMCRIIAAERGRPLISVDRSSIENYVHNMIFDVIRRKDGHEKLDEDQEGQAAENGDSQV